jgi:hypothetical protein
LLCKSWKWLIIFLGVKKLVWWLAIRSQKCFVFFRSGRGMQATGNIEFVQVCKKQ